MKALQGTRVVLAAVNQAAATTPRTALIDTLNASSCKLMVASGANTNATAAVTVTVTTGSNSASTTGYVSVGSSSGSATIAAVQVVDIDMRGKDRYLYISAAPGTSGTTDQVAIGSIVAAMEMGIAPTNSTTQTGNAVL